MPKKILLTAGGTGGHIVPAIILHLALKEHGFFSTIIHDNRVRKFIEYNNVKDGVELRISTRSYAKPFFLLFHFVKLLLSFFVNRPRLVVGFGGYITAPVLLAAKILFIPTIILEQNAVLGTVNRFFIKNAKSVVTIFKNVRRLNYRLYQDKVHQIGMIVNSKQNVVIKSDDISILVTGGSQGAKILSDTLPYAIKSLGTKQQQKLKVYFQTRPEEVQHTKEVLADSKVKFYDVVDFYPNMAELIQNTDIIIARAGAATISEICAYGKASILIPYANSKDDHQRYNALELGQNNAAIVLEESSINNDILISTLTELITNTSRTKALGENARKLYNDSNVALFIKLIKKYV